MAKLPLKYRVPPHCCPYCRKEVGYLGRIFAWLFGTQFHGCDFSNVSRPWERNRDGF